MFSHNQDYFLRTHQASTIQLIQDGKLVDSSENTSKITSEKTSLNLFTLSFLEGIQPYSGTLLPALKNDRIFEKKPSLASYSSSSSILPFETQHLQTKSEAEHKFCANSSFRSFSSDPKKSPLKSGRRSVAFPKHARNKLRNWLFTHRENPYPTEDQKAFLVETTGLSSVQISNWFINARRRILLPMLHHQSD
eukprot:Sdes_comp23432_c0_seq1m21690